MSNAPRYRLVGYDIGTAPDENGGWVHWTDHEAEIARLTAERDAALAGAVKVKPLVWFETQSEIPHHAWEAWTGFGRWVIFLRFQSMNAATYWIFSLGYPTLEAAQAAAQADYAARILAALEDTGEPALIREAAALCKDEEPK